MSPEEQERAVDELHARLDVLERSLTISPESIGVIVHKSGDGQILDFTPSGN